MKLLKAVFIVSIVFLVSGTCSCTTERKVNAYLDKHPVKLASLCALNYPPKTEYLKGKTDTLIKRDTVTGDSIVVPCPEQKEKGHPSIVKCPPNKTITNNVETIRVDTIVKIDSARSVVLRYENRQIKDDKEKVRNFLFVSLALNVVLLLLMVFFNK